MRADGRIAFVAALALRMHNVAIIRVAATGVVPRPRDDRDPHAIRSELGGSSSEDTSEAMLLGADGMVRLRTTQPVAVGSLRRLIEKFPSTSGS